MQIEQHVLRTKASVSEEQAESLEEEDRATESVYSASEE